MQQPDGLTLGELISQLESCRLLDNQGNPKNVQYDFGDMAPTHLMSWRGIYAELAIGYSEFVSGVNIVSLLDELRSGIGKTFEGYKGQDFTMDERTPLHVANYGQVSSTVITGIYDNGYQIILLTAYKD